MNLEIRNVEKTFGNNKVLKDVSFTAEGGKAFGLLGRNGAGKTTAIRIIMGVFPSDNAKECIYIDGAPIDRNAVRLGYLPEERGLYPKKKISEQLVYFAQLHGLSRKDAVASCKKWLKRLDMSQYENKRLDTLSKGNQQKIQLVTALAHDPHIIILDEPFSGLDPVNALMLKDIVKEQIALGKIVLFSSHQMSYIEEFCDSIAILNKGKAALSGDLRDIKRSYARDTLSVRCQSSVAQKIIADYGENCSLGENNCLLIKMPSENDKKAEMIRLINDYDIDEVKIFEPSLNDIFVQYAGEE